MVTNYKAFAIAKHSPSVVLIISYNSKLLLLCYHRPKKKDKL